MVKRSLKATETGIAKAEKALINKGWSRHELAGHVVIEGKTVINGIDIQPIHKFFTGKAVDRRYFVGICKALGISWEEIISVAQDVTLISSQNDFKEIAEIDVLVEKIRSKIQPDIQEQCGKMRVLDMTQPIGLEDIYTDVNVLETVTGNRRLELNELLENFDPESDDFERCGLSTIVEKRVPGLNVVQRYSKLMVLGKPGAGKTTFLKYLAIQCIWGNFQSKKIPIFITLKDFAEAKGYPSLIDFINQFLTCQNISEDKVIKILKNGRFLILFDGLDEVREEDRKRVIKEVETFSRLYSFSDDFRNDQAYLISKRKKIISELESLNIDTNYYESSRICSFIADLIENMNCLSLVEEINKLNNFFGEKERNQYNIKTGINNLKKDLDSLLPDILKHDDQGLIFLSKLYPSRIYVNNFIITCRIAAREYCFKEFTDVEVADFDDKQIKTFSQKWFQRKNTSRGKNFIQKLNNQKSVKELAINPLLLTLLCLIFETSSDFPTNRSELYEEGIAVLLKKWDAERSIERDQVYRKLSTARKEDLLTHIAWVTFNQKDYFFKQRQAQRYIMEYIQNLPEARTDPKTLYLDSEVVLKSIEAQHGLLVERAKGIYSFSHLTFHEYFAARKVVTTSDPKALEELFEYLVKHMAEKRWREVILLTVGMLPSADRLFCLMKQTIDTKIIRHNNSEKLYQFLRQINANSRSAAVPYQASLKALYFALFQDSATCHERNFQQEEIELLKEYHELNRLLITYINSDCYVTRAVRDNIETNLLLPQFY
ncbi:NACHT domain-containing protein [Nostoc cycadae]|uniref:Two-component sensor histidine kinase n=1 Tax=Nostoc cycadae WK-1 TaxID=1861711 RepID=A0A2H6LMY4_9NOSO|nr:NACHT domain-containing protein [Nostoc cycadae]GBE94585.1 two-component sensor histidine kinase [Nostoc cycadae WK-1]